MFQSSTETRIIPSPVFTYYCKTFFILILDVQCGNVNDFCTLQMYLSVYRLRCKVLWANLMWIACLAQFLYFLLQMSSPSDISINVNHGATAKHRPHFTTINVGCRCGCNYSHCSFSLVQMKTKCDLVTVLKGVTFCGLTKKQMTDELFQN